MNGKNNPAGRRPVLLLVDDEPANLRLMSDILAEQYELLLATNTEAALRIARAQKPDLVLMDVVLPGISGLEACRRLGNLAETSDIPVIFITGGSSEDEELACWDAGGVDFVGKPIRPVTLLRRIASHISLKMQSDELRVLAGTDPLTGLANRRTFDSHLAKEWRRCWRQRLPLSMAIIDVDWFKAYNDHYGHDAGDQALRAVSDALQSACTRAGDTVARLGGEEFAVLMPGTSSEGAQTLIGRLFSLLEERAMPHEGSPLARLSASAGVATCHPGPASDSSELMALADNRLYEAKAQGRARFVSSD